MGGREKWRRGEKNEGGRKKGERKKREEGRGKRVLSRTRACAQVHCALFPSCPVVNIVEKERERDKP